MEYLPLETRGIIQDRINGKFADLFCILFCLLIHVHPSAQSYRQYPEIKLKRIMKSVHYANGFNDENLKESAFKLDEIEQILSFNKFINHDKSVGFYNNEIVKKEINQYTLTETMIESLMNG